MGEKAFELLKKLYLTEAQGAGDIISEEIELAKELYCGLNGYDIDKFNEKYNKIRETLQGLFPIGINSSWNLFKVFYSTLLDNLNEEMKKEK